VSLVLTKNASENSQSTNRSNLGPFKGIGRNKKEAKADACKQAMDAIEERRQYYVDLVQAGIKKVPKSDVKMPPFVSRVPDDVLPYVEETKKPSPETQPAVESSVGAVAEVSLESDLPVFVTEKPSYIFMIDLDNSTHLLNNLILTCKKYRLRGVLLEGYAGRVYENPNLPIIIKVIKTQSSVKNAADFLMAYRAAVHSCEYKNSADKPVIVIVSKDFGLEAIVVMLKKESFDAYLCCSSEELLQFCEKWKQQNTKTEVNKTHEVS
jgi:hypothetical protein